MSKILNLFNNTIEDYNKFVNNRAAIYIERINSSIKQIEDFIDLNKDAIIDGILVTQMLNGFYETGGDGIGDDEETRLYLNSDYDIYSFERNKFIIGTNITSIKVVSDLDDNEKDIRKHYYLNIRYDDPIPINFEFNELCADMLGEYSRCFENFTTNLFDKLKRTNFVSIENDLLIKLEHFEKLITKLKN